MGEKIQALILTLCLRQQTLAHELGIGYDTVRGWSSGRAEPSADNRVGLAAFMRQHAARLVKLADELEG